MFYMHTNRGDTVACPECPVEHVESIANQIRRCVNQFSNGSSSSSVQSFFGPLGFISVTTVLEGASRTIGLEVGNLLPLVQLLASPGTNFFHPRKSATVFALAAGIHTAADLNNRNPEICDDHAWMRASGLSSAVCVALPRCGERHAQCALMLGYQDTPHFIDIDRRVEAARLLASALSPSIPHLMGALVEKLKQAWRPVTSALRTAVHLQLELPAHARQSAAVSQGMGSPGTGAAGSGLPSTVASEMGLLATEIGVNCTSTTVPMVPMVLDAGPEDVAREFLPPQGHKRRGSALSRSGSSPAVQALNSAVQVTTPAPQAVHVQPADQGVHVRLVPEALRHFLNAAQPVVQPARPGLQTSQPAVQTVRPAALATSPSVQALQRAVQAIQDPLQQVPPAQVHVQPALQGAVPPVARHGHRYPISNRLKGAQGTPDQANRIASSRLTNMERTGTSPSFANDPRRSRKAIRRRSEESATSTCRQYNFLRKSANSEVRRYDFLRESATSESRRYDFLPESVTSEARRDDFLRESATVEARQYNFVREPVPSEAREYDFLRESTTGEARQYDFLRESVPSEAGQFNVHHVHDRLPSTSSMAGHFRLVADVWELQELPPLRARTPSEQGNRSEKPETDRSWDAFLEASPATAAQISELDWDVDALVEFPAFAPVTHLISHTVPKHMSRLISSTVQAMTTTPEPLFKQLGFHSSPDQEHQEGVLGMECASGHASGSTLGRASEREYADGSGRASGTMTDNLLSAYGDGGACGGSQESDGEKEGSEREYLFVHPQPSRPCGETFSGISPDSPCWSRRSMSP
eukprot:jgi/Botrbrau1/3626/Bobra.0204s0018.1